MGGDPRKIQGSIVGPGGPYDENEVIIDTTNALLLDGCVVSLVGGIRRGEMMAKSMVALQLDGRIIKTEEHISCMVLTNADGAAALVTQLVALAHRAGFGEEFREELKRRSSDLPM